MGHYSRHLSVLAFAHAHAYAYAVMASMRFCAECNNLLYPKADKIHKQLLYSCRNCDWFDEANSICVYRSELITELKETAGVTQDIATDPTLPRAQMKCPRCGNDEAVFYQDQQTKRAESRMTLFYVCTQCSKAFQDPILKERQQARR